MPQGWDNFYYLVGSAASGLIGLLFVVATLTQGRDRSSALRGAALYMTPTVAHFGVVLAISAVAQAPALTAQARGGVFAVLALGGLGLAVRASIGIARPRSSAPHWSDLWCYGAAPAGLYLLLLTAIAAGFWNRAAWAAPAMAAALLILLLLAIRNAWDLITWMAPRGEGRSADALGAVAGDQAAPQGEAVHQAEP